MFRFILEIVSQMFELSQNLGTELNLSYSEYAKTMLLVTLVLALSIYIFKSIAIFLMAKNNKLKLLFLAFIPFANYYLLGKITGEIRIFSLKVKNVGIWLGLLLFVTFIINNYIDIYCYYDEFYSLLTTNVIPSEITYIPSVLINVCLVFSKILYFVNIVFVVWFNISLLSRYLGRNTFWISLIMILVYSNELFYISYSLALAIIVMIIKNRKPFNLGDFFARQRQAYETSQRNSAGGYQSSSYTESKTIVDDDPFEEFSSKDNGKTSSFEQDVFSDFTPKNDYSKNNDNSHDDKN